MAALPYHHRGISRLKAEELLQSTKQDGSFLIRESETVHGAYTLCLLYQSTVHQYRILADEDGKLSIQGEAGMIGRKYVDLTQLTHEYIHRGSNNGLVCALLYPVNTHGQDDSEKESDDEEEAARFYDDPATPTEDELAYLDYEPPELKFFRQRFSCLDLSSFDGEFVDSLRSYVEDDVLSDCRIAEGGGARLTHLHQLLAAAARDFEKQHRVFLERLQLLGQLFQTSDATEEKSESVTAHDQQQRQADLDNDNRCSNTTPDLDGFLQRLPACKTMVANFEEKAFKVLSELDHGDKEYDDVEEASSPIKTVPHLRMSGSNKVVIPSVTYEVKVKQSKLELFHRTLLTIDFQSGKLYAVRQAKSEVLDQSNTFIHDQIIQLIKSTTENRRLDVIIVGRKKDTYIFDDVKTREKFCQHIQQLKNLFSDAEELDRLSVFIGTWNMGDASPPWKLHSWLRSQGVGMTRDKTFSLIPHDLYVIGTQESSLPEKDWANKIKAVLFECLHKEMHLVSVSSLWGLRLVVFVRQEYKNKISHVQTDTVKCGIANTLGNKGAIGLSFYFNATSFCFINCHLTSGNEKNVRRNQNFHDILKGLSLGQKKRTVFDVSNQFTHLFWFGDLNYRLEEEVMPILQKIKAKDYGPLLQKDQLRLSMERKDAFLGFSEEEIQFPPTYRLKRGSNEEYEWQKFKTAGTRINVPSWCDRVLWKSFPEAYIECTSYGSAEDILTSDHKPVFASFDVAIATQYVPNQGTDVECNKDVKIIFENVTAELKTSLKQQFKLEFHSVCLPEPVLSKPNIHFCTYCPSISNQCAPTWQGSLLPRNLNPIITERDYLEDQHILIALKTFDGEESYGECVLALRSMFSISPQSFECRLTHLGEETGKLRGQMYVKGTEAGTKRRSRPSKSYELVSIDVDLGGAAQVDMMDCPIYKRIESIRETSNPVYADVDKPPPIRNRTTSLANQVEAEIDQSDNILTIETHSSQLENRLKSRELRTSSIPDRKVEESSPRNSSPGRVESPPLVPPRAKPRINMGRAILNQTMVLPMASPTHRPLSTGSPITVESARNSESETHSPRNGTSSSPLNKRESVRFQGMDSLRRRQCFSWSDSSQDGSFEENTNANSEKDVYSQVASYDEPPPLLPRKMRKNPERAPSVQCDRPGYEKLANPGNINEWLLNLGLPQYIPNFLDHGWDQFRFVDSITDKDLVDLGMDSVAHRKRVLDNIREMKSW